MFFGTLFFLWLLLIAYWFLIVPRRDRARDRLRELSERERAEVERRERFAIGVAETWAREYARYGYDNRPEVFGANVRRVYLAALDETEPAANGVE